MVGALILTGAMLGAGSPAVAGGVAVLTLKSEGVEVGVAPRLSGRVVVFRRDGGPNLLKWDPAFERAPEAEIPRLEPGYEFKPYHGHVVWIGPQSEWWADQDLDLGKRTAKAEWPPDPWGEVAPTTIMLRTPRRLVLAGQSSPVSGLSLTKEVEILRGGVVRVSVTAKNIRDRPVTRDLWSNTRVPGGSSAFVAVGPGGRIKVEHQSSDPGKGIPISYRVFDGWFTFLAAEPLPEGVVSRVSKAFITPRAGLVAAFVEGFAFLKRFEPAAAGAVHPAQGVVEIYQQVEATPAGSFLELEHHSALTTLGPGESLTMTETWSATPYAGEPEPAARAAFLTTYALSTP